MWPGDHAMARPWEHWGPINASSRVCLATDRRRAHPRTRSADMKIDAFGLRIAIRSNSPAIFERLPPYLPIGWKRLKARCVDRQYSLCHPSEEHTCHAAIRSQSGTYSYAGTNRLDGGVGRPGVRPRVVCCRMRPKHVFVHAGVVAWQGRAILVPGRSYSGKSTLVAALCHAGAKYYSDEYALIDRQGRVHPYPRPLRLRHEVPDLPTGAAVVPEQPCPGAPLPVSLVVLTHYQAKSGWNPATLSKGKAILELMANTMSAQRQPKTVLTALQRALLSAHIIQGPRPEATEIVDDVLKRAERAG